MLLKDMFTVKHGLNRGNPPTFTTYCTTVYGLGGSFDIVSRFSESERRDTVASALRYCISGRSSSIISGIFLSPFYFDPYGDTQTTEFFAFPIPSIRILNPCRPTEVAKLKKKNTC